MVLKWLHKQIKYRLLEREWDRVLQAHGSWKQYFRSTDPDYNPRANELAKKFHGYPYIAVITKFNWTDDMFGPTPYTYDIELFCKQFCQDKFRIAWNRDILCHDDQYLPNGQSDQDVVYIGFKSNKDYMRFMLTWDR